MDIILDKWRASEVSETLSGVYQFEIYDAYIYIYICAYVYGRM